MSATTAGASKSTVAMGFVVGMVSGAAASGHDVRAVLTAVGINPDDLARAEVRVPLARYAQLYNAMVVELEDEGFALFASPLRPGAFEFLCRSVVSSSTLAEALDRCRRFLALVLPALEMRVQRNRGVATIELIERQTIGNSRNDPRRVFAFEWLLRLVHGLACWLVARSLALNSVRFPYDAPTHAADYSLIYTANPLFAGDSLLASFNANLLDLPIRRDDTALAGFLEGAPGKITTLYRRDRLLVGQVRDILAQALPDSLALDYVADRLHLSPRSLHRHLQEEGSSFRSIKDALRRDIALSMLEKQQASVGEIALSLGYAEFSTFFRAFKKWTGQSPTAYRQRLAS